MGKGIDDELQAETDRVEYLLERVPGYGRVVCDPCDGMLFRLLVWWEVGMI